MHHHHRKLVAGVDILKLLRINEEIISIKDRQSLIDAGKYLELK
jgi:hypothetical protein